MTTTYDPMFLDDLVRVVPHVSRVATNAASTNPAENMSHQSLESLQRGDTIEDDFGEFGIEDIRGWQQMVCHGCMRIYAEPPEPVKLSMVCPECGGVIQNEGAF